LQAKVLLPPLTHSSPSPTVPCLKEVENLQQLLVFPQLKTLRTDFSPTPLMCELGIRGVGSVISANVPFNVGLASVPAARLAEVCSFVLDVTE